MAKEALAENHKLFLFNFYSSIINHKLFANCSFRDD